MVNREILLLGDMHESLHSCYLPNDEWITNYKKGFVDNIIKIEMSWKKFERSNDESILFRELKPIHKKI